MKLELEEIYLDRKRDRNEPLNLFKVQDKKLCDNGENQKEKLNCFYLKTTKMTPEASSSDQKQPIQVLFGMLLWIRISLKMFLINFCLACHFSTKLQSKFPIKEFLLRASGMPWKISCSNPEQNEPLWKMEMSSKAFTIKREKK